MRTAQWLLQRGWSKNTRVVPRRRAYVPRGSRFDLSLLGDTPIQAAPLIVWLLVAIADRRTARRIMAIRWRTSLWLIAVAALSLSLIYASPFGPARNLESAVRWFIFGYPAWLLLSIIWLLPGVAASKRFALNPLWVLPTLAVAIDLSIECFTHWPPTRWWPTIIAGQMPIPSGYLLGRSIEAWDGYLHSLWPNMFMALVSAVSFLLARRLVRS
jgi:hypothetical protein